MNRNCKSCIFKNSHPEDIFFCFALSMFIPSTDKPECKGELFKQRTAGTDRIKELTEALESLKNA